MRFQAVKRNILRVPLELALILRLYDRGYYLFSYAKAQHRLLGTMVRGFSPGLSLLAHWRNEKEGAHGFC